jgi:1-acyl-sn-glycerol-3-phosphate acyltransferase
MLVRAARFVAAVVIRAALRIYLRFEIVGGHNLSSDGSLVLVANHSSHLDTVCLLAPLPLRRLHRAFAAAAVDYFFRSLPRTWIAALIVNALPFARGSRVRRSIAICRELLETPGNILIIFPEGTRSTDGTVHEFKSGIGALVAGRDVAVTPCYLDGAFRAWPKGRRIPRPRKVRLIIGEPRNYATRARDKTSISAIASELHAAVKQLGATHDIRRTHDAELRRRGAVLPFVDSREADA